MIAIRQPYGIGTAYAIDAGRLTAGVIRSLLAIEIGDQMGARRVIRDDDVMDRARYAAERRPAQATIVEAPKIVGIIGVDFGTGTVCGIGKKGRLVSTIIAANPERNAPAPARYKVRPLHCITLIGTTTALYAAPEFS